MNSLITNALSCRNRGRQKECHRRTQPGLLAAQCPPAVQETGNISLSNGQRLKLYITSSTTSDRSTVADNPEQLLAKESAQAQSRSLSTV